MAEANVVRGSIGNHPSRESETDAIVYEARVVHAYACSSGHAFTVPLHHEAEPPSVWDCPRCGAPAVTGDAAAVEPDVTKLGGKTHWEQLIGRRTEGELEDLLAEALHNLRNTGKAF